MQWKFSYLKQNLSFSRDDSFRIQYTFIWRKGIIFLHFILSKNKLFCRTDAHMQYILTICKLLYLSASIFHTRIISLSPNSLYELVVQRQRRVPRGRNYSIVAVYIVKNTKEKHGAKRDTLHCRQGVITAT